MPTLATPLLSSLLTTPRTAVLHSWTSFHAAGAVAYVPHVSHTGDALWDSNNLIKYFTPPVDPFKDSDVDGWEVLDEEDFTDDFDRRFPSPPPIHGVKRRARRPKRRYFSQVRKIRKNGGIVVDSAGILPQSHEPILIIQYRTIDRSLKSSLVLQKYCQRVQDYVDLALVIEIPGPASETWKIEGGGGWWGTARETEKLLAVACRTLMRGRGNGLGVLFGVVLGGSQVRFFKWTDDASQVGGGTFEDLAVLLGVAEDEEDYPSSEDEVDDEIEDEALDDDNAMELDDDIAGPSNSKDKGKGKTEEVPEELEKLHEPEDKGKGKGKARVDAHRDTTLGPPTNNLNNQQIWVAAPVIASPTLLEELPDIFDTPVPPISDRSGYYDMMWQTGKARKLFHYIGNWEVI